MGVYKRQGIFTSLIIYSGFAFGALNTVIFAPKILSVEENGTYRLIITVATILSQLLMIGSGSVLTKYASNFNNKNELLTPIILLLNLIFFIYLIISYFIFNPVLAIFPETYQKIEPYFFWVMVNIYCLIVLHTLGAYCNAVFATSTSNFFREFLYKFIATVAFVLLGLYKFSFLEFIKIYTVFNILLILIFAAMLFRYYHIKIHFYISKLVQIKWREMSMFGVYSFFTTAASIIILQIDTLMVNQLASESVKSVAIYSTAFFIATVIQTPQRSLAQISTPLFAKLWNDNNLREIQNNYIKTTLIQMLAGSILFILIWANIDNIYKFMPMVYGNGKTVVLIVLLAKFIEMASGSNAEILATSKYYKFNFYIYILMFIFLVILNYILIPRFDIAGAALGTLITAIVFNLLRYFILKIKFKLSPFNFNYCKGLCIGLIVGIIMCFMPHFSNYFLDIIVRSSLAFLIYISCVYFLNISEDINQVINRILLQTKGIFK